ncbi:MAG: RbsD/FucU family protein [Oscillospiraceae bacterium]
MLRNVPRIIAPELMKIMMDMGHSDTLILADANFPAASCARRLIRLDGVEVTDLLDAILQFYPLDNFVPHPVTLMQPKSDEPTPEIWDSFKNIIEKRDEEKAFTGFTQIERMPFYTAAKEAYAIVQTTTTARYANIMLQKGVL